MATPGIRKLSHPWDNDLAKMSLAIKGDLIPPHNNCTECALVKALHHKVWLEERFAKDDSAADPDYIALLLKRVEFRIKTLRNELDSEQAIEQLGI